MNTPLEPGIPPREIPPEKSKWRPIGITVLSAVLLGAGSCFGAAVSGGGWISSTFVVLFFVCVIALIVAILWALSTWMSGE
jgi:protein-S-isoprenylcysteine O-methyltransferase Ste14